MESLINKTYCWQCIEKYAISLDKNIELAIQSKKAAKVDFFKPLRH